jgi:hypothetical protein
LSGLYFPPFQFCTSCSSLWSCSGTTPLTPKQLFKFMLY